MVAEIPSTSPQPVGSSDAEWIYTAPPQTRLFAATLWRSGTSSNVMGYATSAIFYLSTPGVTYDAADTFDRCVPDACTSVGDPTQPFAAANEVSPPPANVQGATYLGAGVVCEGAGTGDCPQSPGGAGPPSATLDLYAADITLDDQSVPLVTSVAGGLSSDAPLSGTEGLTFSASDAGPGLYQVNFLVDGKLVNTLPVDNNGGRCVPASPAPSDGTNAFLYGQPCDASANVTDTFNTAQVANGMHNLLVQVTDASGAATTVLDRTVQFQNGPGTGAPAPGSPAAPPTPNGTNASSAAVLHVRWKRSTAPRLESNWGQVRRITGTLTTSSGQPIADAAVGVRVLPTYAGATASALASVKTNAQGAFTSSVAGNASSRTLTFSYDAHVGDPRPAATATLTLLVHAGVTLSVSPHTTAVNHVITFVGTVRGTPVPLGGKQLVLEARSPGSTWIEFQVIRTNAKGRFQARYRFRFAGPADYQFRAVSEYEAAFPFISGASGVVGVFER